MTAVEFSLSAKAHVVSCIRKTNQEPQFFWEIKGLCTILVSYLDPAQCYDLASYFHSSAGKNIYKRALQEQVFIDSSSVHQIHSIHKKMALPAFDAGSLFKTFLISIREFAFSKADTQLIEEIASSPKGAEVVYNNRHFLGRLETQHLLAVMHTLVTNEALFIRLQKNGVDTLDRLKVDLFIGALQMGDQESCTAIWGLFDYPQKITPLTLSEHLFYQDVQKKATELTTNFCTLGLAAFEAGHAEDAILYLTRTCAIHHIAFGEEHSDLALFLNHLGETWRLKAMQGRDLVQSANCAIKYHRRALTVMTSSRDEEHLVISKFYTDLARSFECFMKDGCLRENINNTNCHYMCGCHERALDRCERALGKGDPEVGLSYYNFGNAMAFINYDDALEYFDIALHLYEKAAENHQVDIARVRTSIDKILQRKAALERSEEIEEEIEFSEEAEEVREIEEVEEALEQPEEAETAS